MNDLAKYFPNNTLGDLADDLVNVNSWDDFERRFLYGTGKAKGTYKTYMVACKAFHQFTKGEHPMAGGTVANVEAFYDELTDKGLTLNTIRLRMAGLRYMFSRVQDRFPFWQSPFDEMSESVRAKLNRSETDTSERGALTAKEYRSLLSMLKKDTTLKGLQNYAMARFLVVSGLRAFEACSLQWHQIDESDSGYRITVRGKGGKVATITIEDGEAIKALRRAFRARWNRAPKSDDLVFHSLPTGKAKAADGITRSTLHSRSKAIIKAAQGAGIVRANLSFSTHGFRHTSATLLVEAGVDIHSVQRHMRHSSLETTQVYLHTQADKSSAWAIIHAEETRDISPVMCEAV